MKKLLLLLLLISVQFSFGQNRFKPSSEGLYDNDKVVFNKIAKAALVKNDFSEKGLFQLVEVKNTSKVVKNYNVSIDHSGCTQGKTNTNATIYDNSKTIPLKDLVIQPGETKTFYVKTTGSQNSKLLKANCSNVLINNPITNEKIMINLASNQLDSKKFQ